MRKTSFNTDWSCYPVGKNGQAVRVDLPFDAMQLDSRSADSPGGVNTGWYDAKDYIYEKTFWAPEEWKDRKIVFEFEGVYRKASIYINGEKAESHHYGYTGFYVYADRFLRFGENNVIRVEARNSDQPNSRWYTGTGIYRPVWLYILPERHIVLDGIRAAEAAGFHDLKFDTVLIGGFNDDEIGDFVNLSRNHPWEMRFIESL